MLHKKTQKGLALAYIFGVILVSVLPINGKGSSINHSFVLSIRLDYLLHAAIYIPWIILVWLAFGNKIRTSVFKIASWIFFSLFFAVAMEFIQYLLPYRTYNINDLLSNLLGAIIGLVFVVILSLTLKTRAKES